MLLPLLAALVPAGVAGQRAGGPVSPDSADAIRDTLSRPPAGRGVTLGDVLSFPLEVVTWPVDVAFQGTAWVAARVAELPGYPPARRAWEAVHGAGFRPSVSSDLGGRSGPGLVVGWVGLDPLRLEAGASVRGYQRWRAETRVGAGGWALAARVGYRRLTQEPFWGVGIDTPEEGRSDFLEDGWVAHASLVRSLGASWELSVGGGWEETVVGRGRDPSTPDVQDRYVPGELPGLGTSRFAVARAGVAVDTRRLEGGWGRGVRLGAVGHLYRGVGGTGPDFETVEADASLLLPLASHEHLTLRGWARATRGGEGEVPFTHLPALGGGRTLRGYEWGRFRDRAVVAGAVEYRWELWRDLRGRSRVWGLLFADRGAAAPSFSGLTEARTSVGVGLGGRWRDRYRASGWVAWSDDGPRVSGTLTTELW